MVQQRRCTLRTRLLRNIAYLARTGCAVFFSHANALVFFKLQHHMLKTWFAMIFLKLLLSLAVSIEVFAARGIVSASSVPPLIRVDLERPPEERWSGALAAVLEKHAWEDSFGPVFEAHDEDLFSRISSAQWTLLENATRMHFPDRSRELDGIALQFAQAGHSEVNFQYLCGWLFFHELAHSDLLSKGSATERSLAKSCTGIVARTESSFFHGRNMDQSPPQVRNCTLRVDFVQGNKTVFSAVDWYWFTTGVMTAVMPGVAALQENWRFHVTGSSDPMDSKRMISEIASGAVHPQMFIFRDSLLAPQASYESVLTYVRETPLAAPEYVVISGPKDAAIVARDPKGVANLTALSLSSSTAEDLWFAVQTNYDRNIADPDDRRTVAENLMRQYGQEIGATEVGLYAALSTFPVHNPTTAYTAIMHAATGSLEAFQRVAMEPAASAKRNSMTLFGNKSDQCANDNNPKTYSLPVDACFSPAILFPGDPQWGPSDIFDAYNASHVTRRFFSSTNGICANETSRIAIPLGECVGPFGRPRPWGQFAMPHKAEVAKDDLIWKPAKLNYKFVFSAANGGCLTSIIDSQSGLDVLASPMHLHIDGAQLEDACKQPAKVVSVEKKSDTRLKATMRSNTAILDIHADLIEGYAVHFSITVSNAAPSQGTVPAFGTATIELNTPNDGSNYRFVEDGKQVPSLGNASCSASVTKASNWYFEFDCPAGERLPVRTKAKTDDINSQCQINGTSGTSMTKLNLRQYTVVRKTAAMFSVMGVFFRLI